MLAEDAVRKAYREAAIKAIGEPISVEEMEEGLDRLNGFLDSLFGAEIGELLTDVQVPIVQRTADNPQANFNQPFPENLSSYDQPISAFEQNQVDQYVLAPNSRVLNRITTPTTVFFPQYPGDGARIAVVDTGATATLTLDGNGRRIDGFNTITSNASATYFYRADLGQWQELAPLTLTDPVPLPREFDRLLVCGTAIALTGLDQINPTTGTMFTYERLLKRCRERYFQRQAVTSGGQNLVEPWQSYDHGWWGR